MLCSPKIGDYLEVLTEDEVKDFEMKNFREFFISTKEKFHSKLCEEQKLENLLNHFLSF